MMLINKCKSFFLNLISLFFISLIYIYRFCLKPMFFSRAVCRFNPSCSAYALVAFKTHSPIKAFWLSLSRISKCHPFGSHGYDPVPKASGDSI